MSAQKAYLARFTPFSVESKHTRNGVAQLKARGIIENRNGAIRRSVIAYGRLHDEIAPQLEPGRPVLLKGFYERVENRDGSRGGEFFKPFTVIRSYDIPTAPEQIETRSPSNDTGRTVQGHDRVGHWRWQWCGKGRSERRRVFVRSTQINGGKKAA